MKSWMSAIYHLLYWLILIYIFPRSSMRNMLSFWRKFCKSYLLGKIRKLKLFKILIKNKTRLWYYSLQSNPIFWTPPFPTPPYPNPLWNFARWDYFSKNGVSAWKCAFDKAKLTTISRFHSFTSFHFSRVKNTAISLKTARLLIDLFFKTISYFKVPSRQEVEWNCYDFNLKLHNFQHGFKVVFGVKLSEITYT